MIDPFEKMNVNLELAMVWVLVSPKNIIVLRLNLFCEGMLCGSVVVLRMFGVIYSCLNNCLVDVYWNLIRLELCSLLKSSLESNVDFSMVPDVADVHYNFQIKKENLSCPFYVSFVGETFF